MANEVNKEQARDVLGEVGKRIKDLEDKVKGIEGLLTRIMPVIEKSALVSKNHRHDDEGKPILSVEFL